jgi:hypothetical protein
MLTIDAGVAPQPWNWNIAVDVDRDSANMPYGPNAPNDHARAGNICPGASFPIPWNVRRRQEFLREFGHMTIPTTRYTTNGPDQTWPSYFGLNNEFAWFATLAAEHANYSKYWNGSITMEEISCLNGPAMLVETHQTKSYAVDASLVDPLDDGRFAVFALSKCLEIPTPSDLIGLFTQINFTPSDNYVPGTTHDQMYNLTHAGPLWLQMPNRAQAREVDPTLTFPSSLRTSMIADN